MSTSPKRGRWLGFDDSFLYSFILVVCRWQISQDGTRVATIPGTWKASDRISI